MEYILKGIALVWMLAGCLGIAMMLDPLNPPSKE